MFVRGYFATALLAATACLSGCSDATPTDAAADFSGDDQNAAVSAELGEPGEAPHEHAAGSGPAKLDLSLAAEDPFAHPTEADSHGAVQVSHREVVPPDDPERFEQIVSQLRPLHSLVGSWWGVTEKAIGGARAIAEPAWSWDFHSHPGQPALVVDSPTSPYIRHGVLTWLPEQRKFELTGTGPAGSDLNYRGTWKREPAPPSREGAGSVDYALELVSVSPRPGTEKLVLSQQGPGRYRLELHQRRGDEPMNLYDAIEASREPEAGGDSNQPAQHCIISGGSATLPIEHDGTKYWLCCDGCRKAFEANPERWIRRHERQHAH